MHIYDSRTTKLKDMPIEACTQQFLNVEVDRYRCIDCNETISDDIPFKHPGTRITRRAAEWIKALLLMNNSIKAVSKLTGIHWETISRIHKNMMLSKIESFEQSLKERGYKPKYLAIDEFAIYKGHTYATCVMDLEIGNIIWVGKGRAINDFRKFFEDIDKDYLSDVAAVAMDMNASFNKLVKEYIPHADIVYDRYHFQAQFGKDVLGAVRLEEARERKQLADDLTGSINSSDDRTEILLLKAEQRAARSEYGTLKRSRWTLPANKRNLSDNKMTALNKILSEHSKIATCYALKEDVCGLFELTDEKSARKGWTKWFNAAKQSGIPQLMKFASIKESRIDGLVAHAKHSITTGRLEGYSNKIKVVKRIGYGCRNEEYFFTLIKYLSLPANRNQSQKNP